MSGKLHLVFGGELVDLQSKKFKDPHAIDLVGIFPDYKSAFNAWKEVSQKTVDNAMTRYYIAKLYQLIDEKEAQSPTQEFPAQHRPR